MDQNQVELAVNNLVTAWRGTLNFGQYIDWGDLPNSMLSFEGQSMYAALLPSYEKSVLAQLESFKARRGVGIPKDDPELVAIFEQFNLICAKALARVYVSDLVLGAGPGPAIPTPTLNPIPPARQERRGVWGSVCDWFKRFF